MNEKHDLFELKISLTGPHDQYDDRIPQTYAITQAVLINGKNIAPKNPIDLRQLAKSCQLSGEFFIVTCGCGEPGCAGIEDGIRVSHFTDRICWIVPEPISVSNLTDEEYKLHRSKPTFLQYTFDPASYLSAVQAGIREAKSMLFDEHQPVDCSPYGFDPDDLLALDPLVFSERGASPGCEIVGKKILIEHSLGDITINGIWYRLSELPVPDDIKNLDDWSAWKAKPCGQGFAYNYASAPEWESRRRKKILGEYLASIASKKSRVVITLRDDWKNKRKHQVVLSGKAL